MEILILIKSKSITILKFQFIFNNAFQLNNNKLLIQLIEETLKPYYLLLYT